MEEATDAVLTHFNVSSKFTMSIADDLQGPVHSLRRFFKRELPMLAIGPTAMNELIESRLRSVDYATTSKYIRFNDFCDNRTRIEFRRLPNVGHSYSEVRLRLCL